MIRTEEDDGRGCVLFRYQSDHPLYRRLCLLKVEESPYFLLLCQDIDGDWRCCYFNVEVGLCINISFNAVRYAVPLGISNSLL